MTVIVDEALVPDYLTEQVMGMLGQLGYRQIMKMEHHGLTSR